MATTRMGSRVQTAPAIALLIVLGTAWSDPAAARPKEWTIVVSEKTGGAEASFDAFVTPEKPGRRGVILKALRRAEAAGRDQEPSSAVGHDGSKRLSEGSATPRAGSIRGWPVLLSSSAV